MAEFNRLNVPPPNFSICDDSCVAEISHLQSESIRYANVGILLGLVSSAVLALSRFKIVSGTILLGLGSFFLYGFLADNTRCEFPDDEGLWTPPSPCGVDDYLIPAIFYAIGAMLIGYGLRNQKRESIKSEQ